MFLWTLLVLHNNYGSLLFSFRYMTTRRMMERRTTDGLTGGSAKMPCHVIRRYRFDVWTPHRYRISWRITAVNWWNQTHKFAEIYVDTHFWRQFPSTSATYTLQSFSLLSIKMFDNQCCYNVSALAKVISSAERRRNTSRLVLMMCTWCNRAIARPGLRSFPRLSRVRSDLRSKL